MSQEPVATVTISETAKDPEETAKAPDTTAEASGSTDGNVQATVSSSNEEEDVSQRKEMKEDDDVDFGDTINSEFVDLITPDIMAHLLSKDVSHFGEEDVDEEESDVEEDDGLDEEEEEEFQGICYCLCLQSTPVTRVSLQRKTFSQRR